MVPSVKDLKRVSNTAQLPNLRQSFQKLELCSSSAYEPLKEFKLKRLINWIQFHRMGLNKTLLVS